MARSSVGYSALGAFPFMRLLNYIYSLNNNRLGFGKKLAQGWLQEGKIDGDWRSLPISGHSHLLVQTVELLFVCLPLHLSCLALAALQNLDLVVEVAKAQHRVDLLRAQQAQVGEGGLDVVDEPLYQPLAPVHEHLYDVPVLDLRAGGSHRAVVGQVAARAEGQQLGIVEEALVEAVLGRATADPNDEAIILENVSCDPEFGEAGREGFCSNDLVEIFAIL